MAHDPWLGKSVLITGVCGTIGRELTAQLLDKGVRAIIGVDNDESRLFEMGGVFRQVDRARFFLGDVRDRDMLKKRMTDVDVVVHTAAFKHVDLCEAAPSEAIATNIGGVQNVIEAAFAANVERVLFTSSDKAVNPTNVMGTSKLMGERLMTAANEQAAGRPLFVSTRFGNVVGSRGSVVPLFRSQIADGGPVTLTDPTMTRFFMSCAEAASLLLESAMLARGGEAFVMKMPVARIEDVAHVMIQLLAPRFGHRCEDIPIRIIGARPGEKFYEELLGEEELRRTVLLQRYMMVLPPFRRRKMGPTDYGLQSWAEVDQPYRSSQQEPMSREALAAYLRETDQLGEDVQ